MSLSKIISELSRLKPSELEAVEAACKRLRTASDEDPHAHLLGMIARAVGQQISYNRFKATTAAKGWRDNSAGVMSFVDLVWPGATRLQQHAIITLCLELLINDLKNQKVPVTLGSVCANLARIPQVFDSSFPGYRQHGLARLILQQMGVKK